MNIGVVGNGFVGKATSILHCKDIQIKIYDVEPSLCVPFGLQLKDLTDCDLIFISVPTPVRADGSCYVGIVETVVNNLKEKNIINEPNNFAVIRSTVIPGTSDRLECYFMPEFLTELHFMEDFRHCSDWIFGLKENTEHNDIFKGKINKLFTLAKENDRIVSNITHFVPNKEAEMVKYFRNCFLAMKVGFCNEIFEYCNVRNIDYETVRELAATDSRIGQSHTKVPGPDGKMGYGGTCFPKDTKALLNSMKTFGMKSYLLDAMDNRNDNKDRPEKDWCNNVGRTVIS